MARDTFDDLDVGNDDLEDGDSVALLTAGKARLGFMPKSMLGTMNSQRIEIVGELQEQVMAIREAQDRVDHLVHHARDAGMSWAAIGWCTGLTSEGARLKWASHFE